MCYVSGTKVVVINATTYDLYTDFQTFTRLNTAIGTENPTNGLVARH